MAIKQILLVTMTLFICQLHAQKLTPTLLADSIKIEISNFFVQGGILHNPQQGLKENYVYASEVLQKSQVGSDENGIYRIGVYQSHSREHILIKQKEEFRIFNLEEIGKALTAVISHCENNNITAKQMFDYMREVMSIYQQNHYSETSRLPKARRNSKSRLKGKHK